MSDELFGVRNSVYLGAYQQAISDALSVSAASDAVRVERDFFMYRAFVEQGQYRVVMDEVTSDSAIPVQAVKQLATYLDGGRPQKDAAIAQIKEWLTSTGSGDWMLLYIAGTLLMHEDEYKEALKYTHSHTNLDVMALVVQLYIGMHRMDLARKQFESMQQRDDDATLTKLSGAFVALAEGGDKCQDALYEFMELGERYFMSTVLLNAMALAYLHLGNYQEAEQSLQAASKSSSDPNTLANIIVCYQHLRKPPDVISRYVNQLLVLAPNHPWAAKHADLQASFDRCEAQFLKA